jgi:ribonuclease E
MVASDDDGEPREDDDEIREGGDRPHRADDGNGGQRKRRRGRRGGRRGRRGRGGEDRAPGPENGQRARLDSFGNSGFDYTDPYEIDTTPVMEPRPQRQPQAEQPREAPDDDVSPASERAESTAGSAEPTASRAHERPKEREPVAEETGGSRQDAPAIEEEDPNRPKRSGWWQRRSFF